MDFPLQFLKNRGIKVYDDLVAILILVDFPLQFITGVILVPLLSVAILILVDFPLQYISPLEKILKWIRSQSLF